MYYSVFKGNMSHIFYNCFLLLYLFRVISGITMNKIDKQNRQNFEQATFGAGCFWCVEAIFERSNGIEEVRVGYTGGKIENPSYEDVCSGITNHVEVIQLDFNPHIISYNHLLDIFWESHDPTTLNRQGADIGTQYRSVVFYHNEMQREIAEISLKAADKMKMYENPIVTEIIPLTKFYPAEEYHQNYYRRNINAPYCQMIIQPKLKKLFNSD